LGGKQLDQEELVLSLLELRRIRAEKDDGFTPYPTEKWNYLQSTPEYKKVAKIVKCPLEMGMLMHTISGYLKDHDAERIDATISKLLVFKIKVQTMLKANGKRISLETSQAIRREFDSQLILICSNYVMRRDYLRSFADICEKDGQFEIAFVDLFVKMANEPLVYA